MKAVLPFLVHSIRSIVIDLTNVGLVAFVCAWMSLGCGPGVIKVQPPNPMAFQEMLSFEMSAEARRPAHWMGYSVRGETLPKYVGVFDDAKLVEAYTHDGGPGVWPSQYHLSYAALRVLRQYYAAAHPGHRVLASDELVEVVDAAGGNTYAVNDFDRDRHLDIADVEGRFVFKIVPPGPEHREAGKKKVDWHLLLLNVAMIGVPEFKLGTGYSGEIGVRFAEKAPPWKLTWSTSDGVVQYNWHVLSVEKATEEACRKAYLDNQWHEPTHHEMVRFGRALHEVVERLVQAREKLGPRRAAETMPMLPGTTTFDYMRSLAWWSANDEGIARLLPIMREPPVVELRKPAVVAQASPRRNAHIIGQTIEGYTTPGRPGKQKYNFHMGNSAHKVIGEHYRFTQFPDRVATNSVSVETIVKAARGGEPDLLLPDDKLLRPDLVNIDRGSVFEIKPSGPTNLAAGQTEVMLYLTAINRAVDPKNPFYLGRGFDGDLGVMFADGFRTWQLKWSTTSPGVIQYTWYKLGVEKEDVAKAEALGKAQAEGRWVDLTELKRLNQVYTEAYTKRQWVELTDDDMQPYAEQLEQAVDMMVANRERIRATQNFVNVPIEAIGILASSVLTAELSRLMTGLTKPVPRIPPTSVPVTPTPAPAPPPPLRLVPKPATVPSPRMTPAPKTLPRKAAKLELQRVGI